MTTLATLDQLQPRSLRGPVLSRLREIERELERLSHERLRINKRPPGVGIEERLCAIAEQERLLEVEHEALRDGPAVAADWLAG